MRLVVACRPGSLGRLVALTRQRIPGGSSRVAHVGGAVTEPRRLIALVAGIVTLRRIAIAQLRGTVALIPGLIAQRRDIVASVACDVTTISLRVAVTGQAVLGSATPRAQVVLLVVACARHATRSS